MHVHQFAKGSFPPNVPVPGPISRTTSVGFTPAFSMMEVMTAGFFRKCCPMLVLGATKLLLPAAPPKAAAPGAPVAA
jgi:hypothetical protein